jgi:dihydrofolate reductase
MESAKSRVTVHMVASLDGLIARKDGSVDWLETSDNFESGDTMAQESVEEFLRTIDCYVMGSRTYETALDFEAKGLGWSYGNKPTFVLTSRELRKTRNTAEFHSGDLQRLVDERLKRGSVLIPMVFIPVLTARRASHQENKAMLGRRHHSALLLAAKALVNVATSVIQLFGYE